MGHPRGGSHDACRTGGVAVAGRFIGLQREGTRMQTPGNNSFREPSRSCSRHQGSSPGHAPPRPRLPILRRNPSLISPWQAMTLPAIPLTRSIQTDLIGLSTSAVKRPKFLLANPSTDLPLQ